MYSLHPKCSINFINPDIYIANFYYRARKYNISRELKMTLNMIEGRHVARVQFTILVGWLVVPKY